MRRKSSDRVGLSFSNILGPMFLAHQPALIGINMYFIPKISRHSPETLLWDDLANWAHSLNNKVRYWALWWDKALLQQYSITIGLSWDTQAFGLLLPRMGILRLLLPQIYLWRSIWFLPSSGSQRLFYKPAVLESSERTVQHGALQTLPQTYWLRRLSEGSAPGSLWSWSSVSIWEPPRSGMGMGFPLKYHPTWGI